MSFVWVKIVYKYYEPLTTITLRLLIASILLWTIAPLLRISLRIRREDIGWFLLLAFTEPFCYFLGEAFGMKYVSSTVGSIIVSTIPLFVLIPGILFFKERLSLTNIGGIFLSFCGIVTMMYTRGYGFGESPDAPLNGILLMFFAVFSAVGYSMLIKRLADRYGTVTLVAWQSFLGALYFLPLFYLFDYEKFRAVTPTAELIGALLTLAVFASVLAFLLYIPVIQRIGIAKANVFANLIPVMTAVFSYFVLAESFTVQKLVGMALVIGGLFLSEINSHKNRGSEAVNEP
jgi:drug/metabolite transporter (DMT)-like permease